MAHTVAGAGHVIVLTDKAGRRQIQNRLESINFRPGGAWGEVTSP